MNNEKTILFNLPDRQRTNVTVDLTDYECAHQLHGLFALVMQTPAYLVH